MEDHGSMLRSSSQTNLKQTKSDMRFYEMKVKQARVTLKKATSSEEGLSSSKFRRHPAEWKGCQEPQIELERNKMG